MNFIYIIENTMELLQKAYTQMENLKDHLLQQQSNQQEEAHNYTNHYKQQEALEEINQLIDKTREDRKRTCSIQWPPQKIIDYHRKIYYKDLRKQLNSIVESIEGVRESRGSHNERLLECPICRVQHQISNITAHIIKKHANNYYLYGCALCSKDYQAHNLLENHLRKAHLNGYETIKQELIEQQQHKSEPSEIDEELQQQYEQYIS